MKKKTELQEKVIYLCAPVNALVEGIYEEDVPFSKIKKHGDFGLGTFNDLDGEMVMLDGTVYQIDAEGQVKVIGDEALSPFACVTFYDPLTVENFEHAMTYEAFLDFLRSFIPSPNLFYAFRIDGVFSYMKTRSVPKQENYRPLVEVAEEQPTFEFLDIEGTLAGFFTPSFMASLNVPGLHLHFLSADLRHGGHVLECCPRKGRIGVQFINKLELSLPLTFDFLTCDFTRDISQDIDKAEK